jgi:Transposase DDE domain group 1
MAMTCCGAIPFSKWRWTGLGTGVVFAALPHREHAAAPGTLSHGDARPLLRQFPDRHLTLDLDESFDRGEQELRKFNAYYDDFLPIHIFDTSGRLVVSVLREAATPSDPGPGQAGGRPSARTVPPGPDPSARRQPLCLSGSDDPPIALRSGPEDTEARLCRGCEARGIEYIFGLSGTAPLAAQVQTLEARTAARYAARPSHPSSSSAATWTSGAVLELPAPDRVEAGPDGVDTRYIVTNLTDRRAQRLYERKYCQRGRTC